MVVLPVSSKMLTVNGAYQLGKLGQEKSWHKHAYVEISHEISMNRHHRSPQ